MLFFPPLQSQVNHHGAASNETYQERLARLEGDKESLILQVSALLPQLPQERDAQCESSVGKRWEPIFLSCAAEHLPLHTSSPVGRLKLGASNEQNGPRHPGACKSAKGDEYILCH